MHRFPANPPPMATHPPPQPTSAPFPPQDGPPPQPYPGYPPPPHDARRSNSPYVNAQGIPIPPPPTDGPVQQSQSNNTQPTETTSATGRPSRKRKLQSPAPEQSGPNNQPHQLPPPPPPPHYDPGYYGQPHPPMDSQGNPVSLPPGDGGPPPQSQSSPQATSGGRQLSTSKRAEQNRKAQRAFRERRDAHVKALESRSQLLDAALASADEANRRWEECRALVDQLRVENAALRAALNQLQAQASAPPPSAPSASDKPAENGTGEPSREGSDEREGGEE